MIAFKIAFTAIFLIIIFAMLEINLFRVDYGIRWYLLGLWGLVMTTCLGYVIWTI